MKPRDVIFWTHLPIGVVVGAGILVKAVTGMILAFDAPILAWAERSVQHVAPPAGARRLDAAALLDKAREARPHGKPSGLAIKSDPTAATTVPFGRDGVVILNPYTGESLGSGSRLRIFFHSVEELHRWFWFRPVGQSVSGAVTIGFLALVLSGFYLWWPKSWSRKNAKAAVALNPNLSGKARDWNWHAVIGFWISPLLLILTLTGVVMAYPWATALLYRATGNEPPPARREGGTPLAAGGLRRAREERADECEERPIDVNAAWAQAEKHVPGWISIDLRLPQRPGGPVVASILERDASIGVPARSQLTMSGETGGILSWEPFSDVNAGRKARMWARYLHTGEAGGAFGKFLAFFAAAGAAVLVWTGLSLAWRRFQAWKTA